MTQPTEHIVDNSLGDVFSQATHQMVSPGDGIMTLNLLLIKVCDNAAIKRCPAQYWKKKKKKRKLTEVI